MISDVDVRLGPPRFAIGSAIGFAKTAGGSTARSAAAGFPIRHKRPDGPSGASFAS
ncbi:hypothetical protein [Streptomyces sp. KR80]|uniref:hypothetical protein n=1 Tax=Streptomyces sp. KR80 TaxID=3457426 RepID=UPI003FD374B7